jgi:hypothetical protein
VRLDHLLSKEFSLVRPLAAVVVVGLVGGDAGIFPGLWSGLLMVSTACPFGGVGVERVDAWVGWGFRQASCWVLKQQACAFPGWGGWGVWGFVAGPRGSSDQLVVGVGGGCGVGVCVLFENYTVDASIFVVKLLRADGGCLGTRSR